MMRSLMLLGLPAGATALHLSGPMNDALGACRVANCPEFTLASPDANIQGTGLSLPAFLAPPLNAVPFIYDMEYALNVFGSTAGGRTPGPFNYRAEAGQPQDLTATPTTDHGPAMACMCEKCGAIVEAIFQPVGRMVCEALGQPLPCTDELAACQAVTTRPDGYTGTAADMNIVYPTVLPPRQPGADGTAGTGPWTASSDVCQPEAAFGAYKAAYDLSDSSTGICAVDPAVAGNTEALALAKCVAASRNDVYWAYGVAPADSDIGGFTCGLDYGATPTFPCTFADAALYDFTANTIADTASDTCKECIAARATAAACAAPDGADQVDVDACAAVTTGQTDCEAATLTAGACTYTAAAPGDISPCIGAPECVAHQFTPSMYVDHMSGGSSVVDMICTGLRTSLCDDASLDVINEKKAFFNCPAPSPPSFGCSFDNGDVAAWQAGAPYTGASADCVACLEAADATGQADRQSTCWGPPVCARPAFAGMALSMPPSTDVRNMICYGVGVPDGRPGGWGEDTSDCDAEAQAVIDSKKSFFGCPTTGLAVNFPCTFDEDVPVYARAKDTSGTAFPTSMMAMPNLACYQCITANNNNIAPCIGPPACVADAFTPEIMGGGMDGIVNTICTGLCTDDCSANDILVIEEKQALMQGGCDTRGTPVASACPPEPEPEPEPAPAPAPDPDPVPDPDPDPPAATPPPAPTSSATSLLYTSSLLALVAAKLAL